MSEHPLLADRLAKIEMSGIRRIFDLVQNMKGAIDLSLGQAHFDVPDEVKDAATKAMKDGFNRYTVTQGIPELHSKLKATLTKKYNISVDNIIITGGASGGLFLSLLALVNPGDEVLVPDPYFVLYKHLVNVCGGKPVFVDTYPNFRLTAENICKCITPKTKLLIFNNPVNPTGIAYTAEEIKSIAKVAKEHNLLIISDEIYENFIYDFPHEPMMRHYDNTLLISGFSKTYGMPGWRIGYAIGNKEIIDAMCMLQQFSFVCAPAPVQKAVVSALDFDMSKYIAEYKRKRDFAYQELKDTFEVVKPQGAFYIFPRVPWGTDQEFVKRAIDNNVLIVPGGAASNRNTHFRLSYAAPDDKLAKGIGILKKIAKQK
ncbi:MAG: aspartate aminotransferase [Planctomycetes bacterium RBG_16_43_13]|nr:MAG: aspartate aminotransferase [Planctomycetes bacterium RBG_16_43_13]